MLCRRWYKHIYAASKELGNQALWLCHTFMRAGIYWGGFWGMFVIIHFGILSFLICTSLLN